MKREVDLKEISDGRLYEANDLVKAGCDGCKGCSACCRGMGTSIVLDPLDIFRLTVALGLSFEALLAEKIELNVVDGVILPNLRMVSEAEQCAFLNEEGRCGIHPHRPGICRLFPLGRYYENRSFRYFLQVHECPKETKTKVKVKKWLDTPDIRKYEQFVKDWHYFLLDVQDKLAKSGEDGWAKQMNLYILKLFFVEPYRADDDFYGQFGVRLREAKRVLGLE